MRNPDNRHRAPDSKPSCNFSLKKAFITFLFLLTACALQGTPRHSLDALRSALLNHDADAALKYVDLDSIVDHMVEDAFRKQEPLAGAELDPAGLAVGKLVASAMLQPAKALIRKGVRAAIESDDQLGYFSSIRKASAWYFTIEEKGDSAIVTPRGDDKVRFKMERTDEGYWRITELILKNPLY
jgi:hypothetical protein